MTPIRRSILSCILPLALIWPQVALAKQPVQIRVVQKANPDIGVKSQILVQNADGSVSSPYETDNDGRTVVTVNACDHDAAFVVDPILFAFLKTRKTCDGDPTLVEIQAMQQAVAIEKISEFIQHYIVEAEGNPALQDIISELQALQNQIASGNDNLAAFHAANAAYLLRLKDDPLAPALSFATMYHAFTALGEDPDSTARPMLQFDADQGIYVMTGAGQKLLTTYQAQIGIPVTGHWDGASVGNLRKYKQAVQTQAPATPRATESKRPRFIDNDDDDNHRVTENEDGPEDPPSNPTFPTDLTIKAIDPPTVSITVPSKTPSIIQ